MNTRLKCAYCNKCLSQLSGPTNVVVHKEELYHTECFNAMTKESDDAYIDVLCTRFPDVCQETLSSVLETYGMSASSI